MSATWKEALRGKMPPHMEQEIDVFEGQLELRKQGKIDEKVFAESRLRRGAYGQRYDNGQRHDGIKSQELAFSPGAPTKGPDTHWGAPGMQRIKIPFGGLTPDQLDALAACAEEYSDCILHVTTRQDFQLHYVHIENTPDVMRRLAAAGITTREACGNTVRNVTCCPVAGVCRTEAFDVAPYARELAWFLLGHPDCQDFGRKFKIAFSGCESEACGLVWMHDLGLTAKVREIDGKPVKGFHIVVGGGLGSVPFRAKVLYEFVREDEIMPIAQAVARVFARLGEKKNRNRARLKFLIAKLGLDEFRKLVEEERKVIPVDPRWKGYIGNLDKHAEKPLKAAVPLNGQARPVGYAEWSATNVYQQKQPGYAAVTVSLPLGDITSEQTRALAEIARRYCGENLRTTVDQNMLLRWVSAADLPAVYAELRVIGLGAAGAGTIVDVTACPGTDTCKLGIASSRGLAAELRDRMTAKSATLPDAIKNLNIKISGCFNSCGQHHIADIGFYGNSRKVGNHTVPHFQVVIGGKTRENGGSYGLAVGAVPSKAIPELVDAVTDRFVRERNKGESFQGWLERLGKKELREMLEPFMKTPARTERPEFYSDWRDPREFTIGDMGTGECAGEVVSLFSMEISPAEGEAFEAQLALDEGDPRRADERAYRAMIMAARALVRTQFLDVGDDPARIVEEFRKRFYDTQLFFDRFAGGKFAQYMFARHESPPAAPDADAAHRTIEEAQLFIEAVHACEARAAGAKVGGVKV